MIFLFFFGKPSIKFFAFYIISPAGSVVSSWQAAQGRHLCWGGAQSLPDDTLHCQEATGGCKCGLSPMLDRYQLRRCRHNHKLKRFEVRPPMTPHKSAVAVQGNLRAERLKVMLRRDEFH